MSAFLSMSASDRMELEGIYAEFYREEIREPLRREFARAVKENEQDPDDPDPEFVPETPTEMLENALEVDEAPGLEGLVDALDRAGWELVRLGPRARLTSGGGSARIGKPRIKRLAR